MISGWEGRRTGLLKTIESVTMNCLIADEVITKWGKLRHKRITTALIDYQKAFDSIPHELIPWMRALGLNSRIVDMIIALMPKWQTQFSIHTSVGTVTTEPVTLLRATHSRRSTKIWAFQSLAKFFRITCSMFALSAKKLDRLILTVQRVSTSIGRH